jgi:hypothetical protein
VPHRPISLSAILQEDFDVVDASNDAYSYRSVLSSGMIYSIFERSGSIKPSQGLLYPIGEAQTPIEGHSTIVSTGHRPCAVQIDLDRASPKDILDPVCMREPTLYNHSLGTVTALDELCKAALASPSGT